MRIALYKQGPHSSSFPHFVVFSVGFSDPLVSVHMRKQTCGKYEVYYMNNQTFTSSFQTAFQSAFFFLMLLYLSKLYVKYKVNAG